MSLEPPLLFALHGSEPLGAKIAQHLGLPLAAHEEREFEDGEHKARPLENVRGRCCYVLHALHGDASHSANDKLNRLLFFIATLKDASAARVSAVVPYLAYARKDRKTKPRDPVTMRYVAQLFEAMGTVPCWCWRCTTRPHFRMPFVVPLSSSIVPGCLYDLLQASSDPVRWRWCHRMPVV